MLSKELAAGFQKRIQSDPLFFVKDVLGCSLYDKQIEALNSIFRNARTTIAGCNGPGKTYLVARAALAFLFAFTDSIVITTAPTWRQVENVIWREISTAVSKSKFPLGIDPLKTKISLDDKWYAIGVSSDNPDNVRGFHAENVLVIVDEAAGIIPQILDAIEGTLTSENVRLVYVGNPTTNEGPFYDSFKSPFFYKIRISAFDTPNFKANGIKNIEDLKKLKQEDIERMTNPNPHLVTPYWAWTRLHSWGEDTALFQSLVCANFPKESKDSLISLLWLEQAIKREWTEEEKKEMPQIKSMGIDVARSGDDATVFTVMSGWEQVFSFAFIGKRLTETIGMAKKIFADCGFVKDEDVIVVDDIGLGGGVTDHLIECGYRTIGLNASAKDYVIDDDRIFNNRAQMYWSLKEAFRSQKIKIKDEGKYIRHLTATKVKFHSSGKIMIIPKEEIKKNIGESPDWADSLALAYMGIVENINFKPLIKEQQYSRLIIPYSEEDKFSPI